MRHLTPTLSAFAAGKSIAPLWVAPNGREFYPIAGGSDDPPADPKDPPADPDKTFTQAELDRILQGRLSKFADYDTVKQQLAEMQAANQTESEKAINAAKDEGRTEARAEFGTALALEVFNGAAGRRNADYDTAPALALIDLAKFVKDDGTVDRDAIAKAVDQIVPEKDGTPPTFGGGPRKTSTKTDPGPGLPRLQQAYAESSKNK